MCVFSENPLQTNDKCAIMGRNASSCGFAVNDIYIYIYIYIKIMHNNRMIISVLPAIMHKYNEVAI